MLKHPNVHSLRSMLAATPEPAANQPDWLLPRPGPAAAGRDLRVAGRPQARSTCLIRAVRLSLPRPTERGCKAGVDRSITAQSPAVSGPGAGTGGLHGGYGAVGYREAGLRARVERRSSHGLSAELSTCGPSGGRRDVLVRIGPQHSASKRPGVGGAADIRRLRRATTG